MSGFSIEDASRLYAEASIVDELLQQKHKERLWTALQDAIKRRQPFLDYVVPETIAGPMPVYNRATITLFLMNYCREQQFQVVLLNASTGEMRISGWAEQYKQKQKQMDAIEVYTGNDKKLSSHLKQLVQHHRK